VVYDVARRSSLGPARAAPVEQICDPLNAGGATTILEAVAQWLQAMPASGGEAAADRDVAAQTGCPRRPSIDSGVSS